MKLHFNDYLIIILFSLSISTCFFAYKWIMLRNEYNLENQKKDGFQKEFTLKIKYYKDVIDVQEGRLNFYKDKANDVSPEKQIIIKYKTVYEKINSIPDSLQYGYTDSLLSICRHKPFQRD